MIFYRYLISYEFSGLGYSGWQSQPHKNTLQDLIENILEKIFKKQISIISVGRLDKDVSAFCHYISFKIDKDLDWSFIKYANFLLKSYNIVFKDIKKVNLQFSVRRDCIQRKYLYRIYNSKTPSALCKNISFHFPHLLDINLMIEASKIFLGTHDFNAFRSSQCQAKSSIRTIHDISISYNNHISYKENQVIDIIISGDGFLHNMIRIIVSALIMIGDKKILLSELIQILKSKSRSNKIPTISGKGLFFLNAKFKV